MGVEKETLKEGDGTNFPKKGDELTMVRCSSDLLQFNSDLSDFLISSACSTTAELLHPMGKR